MSAPSAGGESVLVRGTVLIDVERCKGCELCIGACKPGVLTMVDGARNAQGYPYPELWAGCTACQACAQICPDFCFQVWRFDQPETAQRGRLPSSGQSTAGVAR